MMRARKQNRRLRKEPRRPIRINWIALISAFIVADVLALLGWAIDRLADPNTLPIREVHIEGEFRQLQPEQLRLLVDDHVYGGFYSVRVAAIRDALMRNPWVSDVMVRRVWPDGLQVTVYERRAVARWGNKGLLTADAILFSPPQDSYPSGLVHLDGPEGTEALVLAKLHELESQLQALHDEVSQLSLSARRSWSFALKQGPTVMVGRTDFKQRVERFVAQYQSVLLPNEEDVDLIDLRYPNGFAVRSKNRDVDSVGNLVSRG
jgi:cell division protein FtsQ